MMKLGRWVLASAMTASLAGAVQAKDSAALQTALDAYKPQYDTCYNGVGVAEEGQSARVRASAVAACDAYAAGVAQVIRDMNLSDVDKAYPMSLAADAMRVKGRLQIGGGDAEAGLATLVTEVMKLIQFTAATRQGLAVALSSGLQAETALELYKAGRAEEADAVLTNMRGIMDRYAEAYASQPGGEALLRRMSRQGVFSEIGLARDLPQGAWSESEWSRKRLEAYLRSERWRFRSATLGQADAMLGNMKQNVRGDRSEMARLQDELGDRAGADLSYAGAIVAGCVRGDYPAIDKREATRAAIAACALRDPIFAYGASAVVSGGRVAISSSGSIAERGAPYLDRVIDYLGPTATQAVPAR